MKKNKVDLYIKETKNSKELLKEVLGLYKEKLDIIYNEYGKPYLKNNSLFFSVSHSKDYAICAVSNREIGADIEQISIRKNAIKKVCTEKEINSINTAEDFTKIWVKKEAYTKYLGTGIGYGLKNVDTLSIKNIKCLKYEDYYIAIYNNQEINEVKIKKLIS